jgi:hypothetical protein
MEIPNLSCHYALIPKFLISEKNSVSSKTIPKIYFNLKIFFFFLPEMKKSHERISKLPNTQY